MRSTTSPSTDNQGRPLTTPAVALVQFVFVLTAWLLNAFLLRRSLPSLFMAGSSIMVQLMVGIIVGLVLGVAVAYPLTTRSAFQPARTAIRGLAGPLLSSATSVVIVCLLAGLGEEVFFRGTLQVWIGFWWAALLFVVVHLPHAFPKPLRAGPLSYLSFVFFMGVLLGFLASRVGLIAAVTAHSVFDGGVFLSFRRYVIQPGELNLFTRETHDPESVT